MSLVCWVLAVIGAAGWLWIVAWIVRGVALWWLGHPVDDEPEHGGAV